MIQPAILQCSCCSSVFIFFFFNDTATTEIYTLSLHDALPISRHEAAAAAGGVAPRIPLRCHGMRIRSEEHTSELQSRLHLVCRLLLEKKKKNSTSDSCSRPSLPPQAPCSDLRCPRVPHSHHRT